MRIMTMRLLLLKTSSIEPLLISSLWLVDPDSNVSIIPSAYRN